MKYSVAVIEGLLTLALAWINVLMQTVKATLLILICIALLGACGLRGPLYLPEESPATKQDAPTDKDDSENDENDENGKPVSA
jgi:predicted small lipoprotein YifL